MFTHLTQIKNMVRFVFVLICFVTVSSPEILGQGGVGSTRGLPENSGGSSMLEGRVRLPTGRTAGQGVMVRLEGTMVGSRRTLTDHDGVFVFRSLPSGEYYLVVEGTDEYESIRQAVTIQGTAAGAREGNAGTVMSVDIHLFPKAAVYSEEVFMGVPKEAVDSFRKGVDAARGGNARKAVEFLKSAIKLHPTFTQALAELSTQYLKLQDIDHVIETANALLRIAPKDLRGHLNMGIALYNQKKFPESYEHLRQAVELNGNDPVSHYYLGMTYLSVKNYPEAEKELQLAISNGGENMALAHKFLGGLYMSSRKNREAADELEKYLKLDPKAPDAVRIKGTIKDLRDKQ